MAKKIESKKSSSPSIKKKIQRQNTMEQTAEEGQEFLKNLDKIIKRQKDEKKKLEKSKEKKEVKNTKKSPKKSPTPTKKAVSKTKKSASPIKKASSAIKVAKTTKEDKKDKTVDSTKPSIFGSSMFGFTPLSFASAISTSASKYPAIIQKDIDSCSKIASSEVVHDSKLGYQIIKKSLKGQSKPEEVKSEKKKPLKTKTGDKLAAGMVDVVFCCDTTSSMSSYLTQCKSTVQEIIKKILDKTQGEGISVKFGFVAYRDHPPQDQSYLTCSYDLTCEEEIKEFITSLSCHGGGDYPEAVMDGLFVSAKHTSWRDSTHIPSLRYIFHIADAPPHGKEFGTHSSRDGCYCDLDINKVSHIINMKQIHYRFINVDPQNRLAKMAEIFKEKIVDYEECNINKAAEMDIKISDMIIRELLPDMVEEEI